MGRMFRRALPLAKPEFHPSGVNYKRARQKPNELSDQPATMNYLLLLILCELVSAAFVREVWTFKVRLTSVERCLLTVLALLPVVGWIAAWEFLHRRARKVTDESQDTGAVGMNSDEPEPVWLILTLGGFLGAVTLYRFWASEGQIHLAGQGLLLALVGATVLGGFLSEGLRRRIKTGDRWRLHLLWPTIKSCFQLSAVLLIAAACLYLVWALFGPLGTVGRCVLGILLLPIVPMVAVALGLFRKFLRAPPVPFGPPGPPLDEKAVQADPDRLELLWLIRNEMDDELLNTMSRAEGGPDHALNLEALAEILRTGQVPRPLGVWPGMLCEFLTLTVDLQVQERSDQIACLFASWVMLNAYAWPERRGHGITDHGDKRRLLVLIQNSLALGPAFVRAAVRFVSWAQLQGKDTHDSVSDLFYLLSRLVLSAASPDAADVASAPTLYEKLVAEEQRVRREMVGQHSPGWPPPAHAGLATPTANRTPRVSITGWILKRILGKAIFQRLGTTCESDAADWLFGLYHDFQPETFRREWVRAAMCALEHLCASGAEELHPGLIELKERLTRQQMVTP